MTPRERRRRIWDAMLGRPDGPPASTPTGIVWSALSANDLTHITGWPTAAEDTVSRRLAMSVTAVMRARGLVACTIADLPLRHYRGTTPLPGPPWLARTDSGMSPWQRMLWTVDDLIFSGLSAWAIIRAADGSIADARRLEIGAWRIDENQRFWLRQPSGTERELPAGECIVIPGPHEGILQLSGRELLAAVGLSRSHSRAATQPALLTEIKYTGERDMSPTEIQQLIEWWVKARAGKNGGVGYSDRNTEVRELGKPSSQLLIEGRNAAAVECARMVGIPASMIDAVTASAGLEYNSGFTRNAEFIDYGIKQYYSCIAARLSEDDVCAAGTRIAFDTTDLTSINPGHPSSGSHSD